MFEWLAEIQAWWGLIGLLVIFSIKAVLDWEGTVKRIRELIFLAEELARKQVLKTGKEKFEWVKNNGYSYLPSWLRLFISEALYAKIVQEIFDKIKEWAENDDLTS